MKKLGIILICIFGISSAQSQDLSKPDTTKVWTKKGNFSLLFNQSNFNNWAAGGENNLSGNLGINYDFNYKKKDVTWDKEKIHRKRNSFLSKSKYRSIRN